MVPEEEAEKEAIEVNLLSIRTSDPVWDLPSLTSLPVLTASEQKYFVILAAAADPSDLFRPDITPFIPVAECVPLDVGMRSMRSPKWGVWTNPPNPPGYGPGLIHLGDHNYGGKKLIWAC